MSTTLPVSYSHLIEGFSKGIDRSGPFYRVVYKIESWSDSDDFVNALMGAATLSGPISGGSIVRNTPHQHPLSAQLFCESATVIQGLGNPALNANGYPDYDGGALVQAEYRVPPFDYTTPPNYNNQIDPSTPLTYCTQSIGYQTEIFTVAPTDTTKTTAKIQISVAVLNLTFHDLPYIPMTKVRAAIGRVNSSTFLGSATGLVLFKGAETQRQWKSDGTVVQEVKMTFHERPSWAPWNSLPSKSNPYTWSAATDGNSNKAFLTYDLNLLIFS